MSLKPYSKFSIVDKTVAPSIDQEVLHRGSKQAKELTQSSTLKVQSKPKKLHKILHKDEVTQLFKSQICTLSYSETKTKQHPRASKMII